MHVAPADLVKRIIDNLTASEYNNCPLKTTMTASHSHHQHRFEQHNRAQRLDASSVPKRQYPSDDDPFTCAVNKSQIFDLTSHLIA